MMELSGVLPPLATPFTPGGGIDLPAFSKNIERLSAAPLSGFVVLGSNGEASFLTEGEKLDVFEAARKAIPRDRLFIAGTGQESTRATVELTNRAADAGCDAALVLAPCYYKGRMTPEALSAHYRKVADAARVPVLIYNIPAATGMNLPADLVVGLGNHGNIAGVKDSSGDMLQLSEIARRVRSDFAIFVGSSPQLYTALCLGASGGILAVANVVPRACCNVAEAFKAGDIETARRLHRRLTTLAVMVTSRWGVPALKAAMNMAGYDGGCVRSPLLDITDPDMLAAIRAEVSLLTEDENSRG